MDERRRSFVHNTPAARALRRPQTRTESLFWDALRNRRLDGWKFRRQHPIAAFVVDFWCAELSLAVEVDGSVHESLEQRTADNERQQLVEALGARFFRVSAVRVESDLAGVLKALRSECARLQALTPNPSPDSASLRGRGE